jgi:hypothetical protein
MRISAKQKLANKAAKEAAKEAAFKRRLQSTQARRANRIERIENRRRYRRDIKRARNELERIRSTHAIANAVVSTAGRLGATAVASKNDNSINSAINTMVKPNSYNTDEKSLSSPYIEDVDTSDTPKEPSSKQGNDLTSW